MAQDQAQGARLPGAGPAGAWELVVPNPKLKLMDQVREEAVSNWA